MGIGKYPPMFCNFNTYFLLIHVILNSFDFKENHFCYITMWILWVWLGGISKYGPRPSKLESNTNLRPTAVGRYWAPISQDIGPYLLIPPLQTLSISPIPPRQASANVPLYTLLVKIRFSSNLILRDFWQFTVIL